MIKSGSNFFLPLRLWPNFVGTPSAPTWLGWCWLQPSRLRRSCSEGCWSWSRVPGECCRPGPEGCRRRRRWSPGPEGWSPGKRSSAPSSPETCPSGKYKCVRSGLCEHTHTRTHTHILDPSFGGYLPNVVNRSLTDGINSNTNTNTHAQHIQDQGETGDVCSQNQGAGGQRFNRGLRPVIQLAHAHTHTYPTPSDLGAKDDLVLSNWNIANRHPEWRKTRFNQGPQARETGCTHFPPSRVEPSRQGAT